MPNASSPIPSTIACLHPSDPSSFGGRHQTGSFASGRCGLFVRPSWSSLDLTRSQPQLFRHGVRTILRRYPDDPNQAFWDTYGQGQLLPAGMKQLQAYGVWLMTRYGSFLNSTYSPSRVYVRSTDYDRTLQSSYALLSGLFRSSSTLAWTDVDDQSASIPIPVHTIPLDKDDVIVVIVAHSNSFPLMIRCRFSGVWSGACEVRTIRSINCPSQR